MNELALFAGAGGGILGGCLHGWRTVAAVEIEDYPRRTLLQRQADGFLPKFPIWDDVRTFDGRPWRGRVNVISAGFPCQDISSAGKGKGLAGERSGLWFEVPRIIRDVKPEYVLLENSPMLTGRGLNRVLLDLATLGYHAAWDVFGARHVGAPHRRDRIWIVAHAEKQPKRAGFCENESSAIRWGRFGNGRCTWWSADPADVPDATRKNDGRGIRNQAQRQTSESGKKDSGARAPGTTQSRLGRVANGVAHRVDRLKAIGNGQVPAVAKLAWDLLT